MGVQFKVYVGMYITCQNSVIPDIVEERLCCNTAYKCWDKFCSKCGKELVVAEKELGLTSKVSTSDVQEDTDLAFMCVSDSNDDNIDVYISNVNGGVIDEDALHHKIYPELIAEATNQFLNNEDEQRAVDTMYKYYGKENVTVHFGIVPYYA